MAEQQFQERQIAVRLKIKEIQEGEYVVEEGWKPNYLLTKKKTKASRVNLVGVVLDKEENGAVTNLVLDDGSGKIVVRSFEENKNLKKIRVGEGVLVVGKIRIYNKDKYISPEIVKKIGAGWLKVRARELEREGEKSGEKANKEGKGREAREKARGGEREKELPEQASKKIVELVRELDTGEGVLIEEIKERLALSNTEKVMEKMLESGEIFQNLPGRVKVL